MWMGPGAHIRPLQSASLQEKADTHAYVFLGAVHLRLQPHSRASSSISLATPATAAERDSSDPNSAVLEANST